MQLNLNKTENLLDNNLITIISVFTMTTKLELVENRMNIYDTVHCDDELFIKIMDYDKYYASNQGRIYNATRKIFLHGTINRSGYVKVTLTLNGKSTTKLVHRLIAIHFIPNPDNKPDVNHLGNKNDNRVCMLEWVTKKENVEHAVKYKTKLKRRSVHKIDAQNNQIVDTYIFMKDSGITPSRISNAIKCNTFCNGYKWQYVDNNIDTCQVDEKWYKLSESMYSEINGFTNYQVSNCGRVKGHHDKILKLNFTNGIATIQLHGDKLFNIKVHRLVLMGCNIPNPENKPEVDHVDSNYTNNKLSNLRWSTSMEQGQNIETNKKRPQIVNNSRKKIKVTHDGNSYVHMFMWDCMI
jgi:hypothetical protein